MWYHRIVALLGVLEFFLSLTREESIQRGGAPYLRRRAQWSGCTGPRTDPTAHALSSCTFSLPLLFPVLIILLLLYGL